MGKKKRRGCSYEKRMAEVNRIYDEYAQLGLPNREIWLRHIWPRYGISERTMYNLLKAPLRLPIRDEQSPNLFDYDNGQDS